MLASARGRGAERTVRTASASCSRFTGPRTHGTFVFATNWSRAAVGSPETNTIRRVSSGQVFWNAM